MTNSEQAVREFQRKYAMKTYRLNPETLQREQTGYDVNFMIDLTALISEHYVAKEEVDKMVSERLREFMQYLYVSDHLKNLYMEIDDIIQNYLKSRER